MGKQKNVFSEDLQTCCTLPMTGFYRDGCCNTGPEDFGRHVICVEVTAEFLQFSKSQGNDLTTPAPAAGFPSLKPGDNWCLCAQLERGNGGRVAPRVVLSSTHVAALEHVALEDMKKYARDLN